MNSHLSLYSFELHLLKSRLFNLFWHQLKYLVGCQVMYGESNCARAWDDAGMTIFPDSLS